MPFDIDTLIKRMAKKKVNMLIKNNEVNDHSTEILLLLLLLNLKTTKTEEDATNYSEMDNYHNLLNDLKEHQKLVFEELFQQLSESK